VTGFQSREGRKLDPLDQDFAHFTDEITSDHVRNATTEDFQRKNLGTIGADGRYFLRAAATTTSFYAEGWYNI